MEKLVYAELMNGITTEMMEDKQLLIISDTGVFIITTQENSSKYPNEVFYRVSPLAKKSYGIRMEDGQLVSETTPRRRK